MYFSSLLTRSIMRSTSSLTSMHQWSKLLILTQNSTILAWFSMRSMTKAIPLTLLLLNIYEHLREYGSSELPSKQYILFETIAFSPQGKWACSKCKELGPYSSSQPKQDPFLLLNSRIHSVC